MRLNRSAMLLAFSMLSCNEVPTPSMGDDWGGPKGTWVEVWRDEFDGESGAAPNATNWNVEVSPKNQNGELEYYTERRNNSFLDGRGNLVIQALAEQFEGAPYTSARLNTRGHSEPQYGRIEARIRLPAGKGLWPAFWMLGTSFPKVRWPNCGEIDILEMQGSKPNKISGSAHGPDFYGTAALTRIYELEDATFADDFHVFALEWTQEGMRWLVDEQVYHVRTPAGVSELGKTWIFDRPFYIILNLAVGGMYDGNPDATTQFPAQMLVDYVRVFRLDP